MGIYSNNSFYRSNINNIDAAPGYDDGQYSAQIVMIENCQNQLTMFNGTILNDIQEAEMRINGVDEEEIFAFSENALTSLLSKIKEMFKKLWAKIKAIFQGFMARLEAQFGKNNKQLVEKYRKLVSTKDLTDFEPKHRKPKNANIVSALPGYTETNAAQITNRLNTATYKDNAVNFIEDWDEEKEADEFIKDVIASDISWNSFEKDFMDHTFDDEDTDKVSIYDIMSKLIAFKDIKQGYDKAMKSLNKAIDNMVKEIEKDEDKISKNFPEAKEAIKAKKYSFGATAGGGTGKDKRYEKKDSTEDADWDGSGGSDVVAVGDKTNADTDPLAKYQKALACVSKNAHLIQQVTSKYTQCYIKALNFYNKQNRTIFAKAVAYRRNKNEEVMMEAMAELVEWEADY